MYRQVWWGIWTIGLMQFWWGQNTTERMVWREYHSDRLISSGRQLNLVLGVCCVVKQRRLRPDEVYSSPKRPSWDKANVVLCQAGLIPQFLKGRWELWLRICEKCQSIDPPPARWPRRKSNISDTICRLLTAGLHCFRFGVFETRCSKRHQPLRSFCECGTPAEILVHNDEAFRSIFLVNGGVRLHFPAADCSCQPDSLLPSPIERYRCTPFRWAQTAADWIRRGR